MSRTLCLLTAGLIALTSTAAPVPKGLKQESDYFPLAVGNSWEYVREHSPDQVAIRRAVTDQRVDGKTATVTVTFNAYVDIYRRGEAGAIHLVNWHKDHPLETPQLVFQPGWKEGDSWSCPHFMTRDVVTYTVGKSKEVTVPAGTFLATPVHTEVPPGAKIGPGVQWYAPDVGVVRMEYCGSVEYVLKSFVPATRK